MSQMKSSCLTTTRPRAVNALASSSSLTRSCSRPSSPRTHSGPTPSPPPAPPHHHTDHAPPLIDSPRRDAVLKLDREDDEGDVEYKWRLTDVSETRFQQLVTQMQFRVGEGQGQCLYELGVADDGTPRGLPRAELHLSIQQITHMAQELSLDVHILRYLVVRTQPEVLLCAELLVSRRHGLAARDACVAFCGASGSGKSTLMGVMLSGRLDNGAGRARQCLFNHKHEIDSGHTSSLATRLWSVPRGCAMVEDERAAIEPQDARSATTADEAHHPRPNGPRHERIEEGEEGGVWIGEDGSSVRQPCAQTEECGAWSAKAEDAGGHTPWPNRDELCEAAAHAGDLCDTTSATATDGAAETVSAAHMAEPNHHRTSPPSSRHGWRCIHLIDLGGDIGKHMLCGLLTRRPSYVGLCVSAGASAEGALLYARVCRAMGLFFFIAVTHADTVEEFELDEFAMELTAILHAVDCRVRTVRTASEAERWAWGWSGERYHAPRGDEDDGVGGGGGGGGEGGGRWGGDWWKAEVPLFAVSSVQGGSGLHCLRVFLSNLSVRRSAAEDSAEWWSADAHAVSPTVSRDNGASETEVNCPVGESAAAERRTDEVRMERMEGMDGGVSTRSVATIDGGCALQVRERRALSRGQLVAATDAERCAPAHDRAQRPFRCFLVPSKHHSTPLSKITGRSIAVTAETVTTTMKRRELPLLPCGHRCDEDGSSFEVFLDGDFTVTNVGHVVHGCVARGAVHVGCGCYIGPDAGGAFHRVCICDIHVEGAHVNCARVGEDATFALDTLHRAVDMTHKGKVLVASHALPVTCRRLTAEVELISQSMTENLQPMLYTRNVRQAVRITPRPAPGADSCGALLVREEDGLLKRAANCHEDVGSCFDGGSETRLQLDCEFMFRPEIVTAGSPVVLHWSPHGIAVGRVIALVA